MSPADDLPAEAGTHKETQATKRSPTKRSPTKRSPHEEVPARVIQKEDQTTRAGQG